MFYKYTFPENHKLGELNAHLIYFFEKIRASRSNSNFIIENYFKPEFVLILNRSLVLKEYFELFFNTYKKIKKNKKDEFNALVIKSQNVHSFFADTNIDCKDLRRESIENIIGNQSLRNLLSYLFTTTIKTEEWDIKGHYKIIYDGMQHKVCPFCGVEKMHQSFREDYDHLAAKRHYPLVSIHPKNLVPMCHTCNSKNKGEKDVLYTEAGIRKTMVYPYTEHLDLSVNYHGSIIPQTDKDDQLGNWVVNIEPDNEVTKNWENIFGIKKRYRDDYVASCYEEWLNDFLEALIFAKIQINDIEGIVVQMENWATSLERNKLQNSNLVKAPLFRFFSNCKVDIFMQTLLSRYNEKAA